VKPAWTLGWVAGVLAAGWLTGAAQAACRNDLGALPKGFAKQAHAGQVLVPPGWVRLGTDGGYPDERPASSPVQVKAFWMDRTEVTNAQFAAFVKATGHVTDAERQGGGAVFEVPTPDALRERPLAWWRFVTGANWRHPKGPGSELRGHWAEPVVLVTQADALAYARWLGRDLPTEAEWEHAAKAGRNDSRLDVAPTDPRGRPTANYWQGSFPLNDLAQDGFAGLAPVGCYAANRWGLHDLIGNAWEWTRDAHTGSHQNHANGDPSLLRTSLPRPSARAVIKGGSFLCSPDYCVRYRASAREAQEPDLATSHVGFRTVSRP